MRRKRPTLKAMLHELEPINEVSTRGRFQTWLLLWLTLFSLMASVTAGSVYYFRQIKFVEEEQEKRGRTLIQNLAGQCELGAYSGDPDFLRAPVQRVFSEEDVLFVAIYNRYGASLIQLNKPTTKAPQVSSTMLKHLETSETGQALRYPQTRYDDLLAPITTTQQDAESGLFGAESTEMSQIIGIARLGLSRKPAQQKLKEVVVWGIYLAAVILAMGLCLALFLARHISKPVLALAEGAEAIRKGHLGFEIVTQRRDELGLLATSFNRMSSQLQQTVASLEHLNRNLEKEVAERTKDLKRLTEELEQRNLALLQQRDQLQVVSRLKSEFLANISHELRTPLNVIIGYAELLNEGIYGDLSVEQRESLHGILESAVDLLRLINEILDLSKVEAGRMTVTLTQVDLVKLIEEVIDNTVPLVKNRSYQIGKQVPNMPVEIVTDGQKVRQILVNLLSNAIKFTATGSVRIALNVATDGNTHISVIDTGIGIRSEHLGIIFDEFRQVDGSSTREHGGTGLGLAISRKFARLIGGEIFVKSQFGEGSTFTLVLPPNPPQKRANRDEEEMEIEPIDAETLGRPETL